MIDFITHVITWDWIMGFVSGCILVLLIVVMRDAWREEDEPDEHECMMDQEGLYEHVQRVAQEKMKEKHNA